jgi:isopentenyl phosphate kinase
MKYQTRKGVDSALEWLGFAEVWREAIHLDFLVMEALHKHKLPAIAFSPCAQVLAMDGVISNWDTVQIRSALIHGLVPVVYGDVIFDHIRGGTILSTEEQFEYLAAEFKPDKILLAGIEPGVWKDFPQRTEVLSKITPANLEKVASGLADSSSLDVTGGMKSKVTTMMKLLQDGSCQEITIFSGMQSGNISKALSGEEIGTRLSLK